MRLLQISSIIISEERQRQHFDPEALSDLGEDIFENGLYNAIKVRETAAGPVLLQGERRFRAITALYEYGLQFKYDGKLVPLDLIPVTSDGELTELQATARELLENLRRENLTWQEKDLATAKLHKLRQQEAQKEGRSQPLKDTAAEIKNLGDQKAHTTTGVAEVRRALIIAEHIADPEVAKAASASEAVKIIERKANEKKNTALAQLMGTVAPSRKHVLLNGESVEMMKTLPPQSFDLILTDPPYGVGAQEFGDQSDLVHKYDDSPEKWPDLMRASCIEWTRVAKPQSHAYIFCDIRRWPELVAMMKAHYWDVWPVPIIWSKNSGILPRPEHGPRRTYECVLYAIRGDKKIAHVRADVVAVPPESNKIHAAQKPVALYTELLTRSSKPGDRVLDSYCGSGTIFPAANRCHLFATGIEGNKAMYVEASTRLEAK